MSQETTTTPTENNYKIESGIPLPFPQRGAGGGLSPWQKVFEQMREGDSIYFENSVQAKKFICYVVSRKYRAAQRKDGAGVRVWRLGRK